jgi:L-lactate dehydrogenase complex protein LldG
MEREAFLNRIAERLGRPRLRHAPARTLIGVPEFHRQQPFGTAHPPDLPERFAQELTRVGGEVLFARNLDGLHALLRSVLERWQPPRVIGWARAELAAFELDWLWDSPQARAFGDPGLGSEAELRRALLGADVGITGVDFAIANSGTLVVSAAAGRPRGVSLLPSLHLALVRQSQLVSRMGEALSGYEASPAGLPSAVHFITGPSRTSDIENDLTIGVHGPASVIALMLLGA